MSGSGGRPRVVRRHPEAPGAIRWIVRTLEEAGHETWVVGGAVRDVLLGVDSVDWDLATRARPGQVRRLFRRTVPIGIEHGTVGVLTREGRMVEVTTFRRDVETFGRHAVVEFADGVDEDLGRRDFTINAVAWHPLRDELHDPFDGVGDLERGVLRTVGEPTDRFAEDYLRVLRALRFAGRFGLEVSPATWEALVEAVEHLDVLSPERIREELVKVLEKDPAPSGALGLWAASGALRHVAPELATLVEVEAEGAEDAPGPWSLACLSVDVLPPSRPLVRLAALLAGTGARPAAALLTRLRFSKAATDRVAGTVGAGADPPALVTGRERRRWLARSGRDPLADVARVWGARARVRAVGADDRGRGGGTGASTPAAGVREKPARAVRGGPAGVAATVRALRAELASGAPLAVADLALDGRDLIGMGMRPGPLFGEILETLLERVLDVPALNRRETLARMVEEEWLEGRGG